METTHVQCTMHFTNCLSFSLVVVALLACTPSNHGAVPAIATSTPPQLAPSQASSTVPAAMPAPTPPPGGGASPASPPAPAAGVDRIACSFHWRRSDAHSHRPRDQRQVVLASAGDADAFALGDFQLDLRYDASTQGGAVLSVHTRADATAIGSTYDFASAAAPAHLPASGHGFTGLRYLTHPGSGSELQYFCGAYDAAANLADDAVSQRTPGPAAPAGSRVRCDVEVRAADGTAERRELAVGTANSEIRLGAFSFSARHMPGRHDTGGVMISAGTTARPSVVSSLYQLSGTELPSNLVADAGFTGQRTVADGSGATLTYSCSTL